MNFISNVLDSIPVVGHVKGVVHYAVGDTEGGNNSMYQSTRTSAVLAGGAVGCLAGPAGAALGGVYGGMITDGLVSAAKNEPVGIFESSANIGRDIASGKNPMASVGSASFKIAMDGIGGFGMGGVSSVASKVPAKAVAKTIEGTVKKAAATIGEEMIEKSVQLTAEEMTKIVAKKVSEKAVKKAVETAAIQTQMLLVSAHVGVNASEKTKAETRAEEERKQQKQKEEEKKARENRDKKNTGSWQPPRENRNNKESNVDNEESDEEVFEKFMKLLKQLLKLLYGNNSEPFTRIFENLSPGQIAYLVKIIRNLNSTGILQIVLDFTLKLFKLYFSKDISFTNILSMLEFVATYIEDQLYFMTKTKGKPTRQSDADRNERRRNAIRELQNKRDIIQKIADLFRHLQAEIIAETSAPNIISPYFRDIFSAVYHYYKHRRVPVPGHEKLTVKQYFDLIRMVIIKMKESPEYKKMQKARNGTALTCEMYVVLFGRMFRIIITVRDGEIVLSTAYVVKRMNFNAKEGILYIKFGDGDVQK
uniref:Uncharacterized protein n=1 Tax=Bombyx mori TaxID=7091 RepID=A0A8R2M4P8_BOMMO|nr:uncharacterized protein LOC119628372 isoform X1 [Bombyx mori]